MAGPAVILAYAIGSALASVIGAATGEMAVRYPVRGGFGAIATRYLGPYAGFLTRVAYWTATVVITGVELVSVATYLNYWWPQLPLWAGIAVFGVAIIILNITSVKSFGTLEFFLSSIKVISVIAFILVGLVPGVLRASRACSGWHRQPFQRRRVHAPRVRFGLAFAGGRDVLLRRY